MSKFLLCACALVVAFASPAAAQIQKVQGVAGGYPVAVSVSGSLPPASGGATSANQTNGTQKTQITDGTNSAAVTNSAPGGSAYGVVVRQAGSVAVTGPLTDAELRAAAVPVSAAALPLPSGAATSALQTAGNSSLSSIDATVTLVNAALAKAAATASAWPIKVTDGTNTSGVVSGSQFAPTGTSALVTHERGVSAFYYGASNATHTAKAAAGLICGLLVTAPGAGGNTLTLYNSTGAATSPVSGFDSTQVREWTFGGGRCLQMSTGITVISSGGSAPQFTVLYE